MRYLTIFAVFALGASGCASEPQSGSLPAPQATKNHPYAGFWKRNANCEEDFGLAITPAGTNLYSVTFCGLGGCIEPGTYRPDTAIVDDPLYQVIDSNTLGISVNDGGYQQYTRC